MKNYNFSNTILKKILKIFFYFFLLIFVIGFYQATEYDNKYVWIFKMKDGLIHSVREYNSDILVATQLYDYKLIPLETE